jgi:hypothetical protein
MKLQLLDQYRFRFGAFENGEIPDEVIDDVIEDLSQDWGLSSFETLECICYLQKIDVPAE